MSEKLPDCMMPDGAGPCQGFQTTYERLKDCEDLVRRTVHELYEGKERLDSIATKHLEIFVGADNIVRINVDGICALRAKLSPGCRVDILGPDREPVSAIVMP